MQKFAALLSETPASAAGLVSERLTSLGADESTRPPNRAVLYECAERLTGEEDAPSSPVSSSSPVGSDAEFGEEVPDRLPDVPWEEVVEEEDDPAPPPKKKKKKKRGADSGEPPT
jgi:hypothetical protein